MPALSLPGSPSTGDPMQPIRDLPHLFTPGLFSFAHQ